MQLTPVQASPVLRAKVRQPVPLPALLDRGLKDGRRAALPRSLQETLGEDFDDNSKAYLKEDLKDRK